MSETLVQISCRPVDGEILHDLRYAVAQVHVIYTVNSLKGDDIGDYMREHYGGYQGRYQKFRLQFTCCEL